MTKAILISNFDNCDSTSHKILEISSGERIGNKALDLSAKFPINVGPMIGTPEMILNSLSTKDMYIRSEDFPNIIWLYGIGKEALQLELVDVDEYKTFKIVREGNKETIQYY